MSERTGFKDSALRAVAIIGLIAILVLGAWGIIQLVVGLPDFFNSFGGGSSSSTSQEQVVISQPSAVTSDQPFTLSWAHKNGSGNHGFVISYACAEGLTFAAPVPTGQMQIVPCNTPFNFTNATQSMQLIPVLHTAQPVTTTFTIAANRLADNKMTASSTSGSVTVNPTHQAAAVTATPVAPVAKPTPTPVPTPAPVKVKTVATPRTPSTNYTASGRTSYLYGASDLAVRILSVTPAANGRYVAQFVIENIGTNVARSGWTFTSDLPTDPMYTFLSQPQQKMYPGDKIVYTMGFDIPQAGCDSYYCDTSNPYGGNVKTFSIMVDDSNITRGEQASNNFASTPFAY